MIKKSDPFEILPYACFSVKIDINTFDTIQSVLEEIYQEFRANHRQYLFCNEKDRELFTIPAISQALKQLHPLSQLVILPEQDKLLFGLMEY